MQDYKIHSKEENIFHVLSAILLQSQEQQYMIVVVVVIHNGLHYAKTTRVYVSAPVWPNFAGTAGFPA